MAGGYLGIGGYTGIPLRTVAAYVATWGCMSPEVIAVLFLEEPLLSPDIYDLKNSKIPAASLMASLLEVRSFIMDIAPSHILPDFSSPPRLSSPLPGACYLAFWSRLLLAALLVGVLCLVGFWLGYCDQLLFVLFFGGGLALTAGIPSIFSDSCSDIAIEASLTASS